MQKFIKNNLKEASNLLEAFLNDPKNISLIADAIEMMASSLKQNGRLFSCGNGGSMCDAMHFAEELTGRYKKERRSIPATAIADPSHLSCVGNDYGYDSVFSRYLEAWGNKSDVALLISTSGTSKNVVKACEAAKSKGMKTVGLLGKDGGVLKNMVDIPIIVPTNLTARAQEIHIKIIHILIEGIETSLSL